MKKLVRFLISLGLAAGVYWLIMLGGRPVFGVEYGVIGIVVAIGAFVITFLGFIVNSASESNASPDQESADDSDQEVEDPGTPLCLRCLTPSDRLQHFCNNCGAPLTSCAEIDPMGQIRSMGDTFSRAAASPRKRIVLIGMWCIFIVPLIGCIIGLKLILDPGMSSSQIDAGDAVMVEYGEWVQSASEPTQPTSQWSLGAILQIIVVVGLMTLYAWILIKTTRNYFRDKKSSESGQTADLTPD
jgi:hypothetical protein